MIDFAIPAGKNTPQVDFVSKQNKLLLKGKSYPENSKKFFEDLFIHFKAHLFDKNFEIIIDLDYISSSSVISILEFLKRLRATAQSTQFIVNFYYDDGDDDMLGIGENYKKITGMEFSFLSRL